MKTIWNGEAFDGLQDLSSEEMNRIAGGESLLYWIGYGIASAARLITNS
jgi:hypothetical protein